MRVSFDAMSWWKKILLAIVLGFGVLIMIGITQAVCLSAYFGKGILVQQCPDGELQQGVAVNASRLRRGNWGWVTIEPIAFYTRGASDEIRRAGVRRGEVSLSLVDGKKVTPLPPKKQWKQVGSYSHTAEVKLPKDLKDGVYKLRAKVKTPVGEAEHDLSLSLFAPAKIHVITDRPLYEPGNTIHFRAVLLRARDLAPLDGRPGKWVVIDASGDTVLEETAPAGDFGVVSGNFPLDLGAPTGTWRVRYESGGTSEQVNVQVEPFTLPRFAIEAAPVKAYYRAGEQPRLRGRVAYSSGAPVGQAELSISWSVQGDWPPPTEWMRSALPKRGSAKKDGSFELTLPRVPKDLKGRVTLVAQIAATDPAGDRVLGGAQILLSEDAIQISAVTEFGGGLVDGFNNRVYLRASTAAGQVLPKVELVVRRAWDPNDKGQKATTDEDGVAALQLDPGPAVNVVIPPMPVRPPPKPKPIVRQRARELISGRAPRLKDQVAMDRLDRVLAPCARFVTGSSDSVTLGFSVSAQGGVEAVSSDGEPLDECMASRLRTYRFPAGPQRIFEAGFTVNVDMPKLSMSINGTPNVPSRLREVLEVAALDARRCLRDEPDPKVLGALLLFELQGNALKLRFAKDARAKNRVSAAVASCAQGILQKLKLPKVTEGRTPTLHIGVARFSVEPAIRYKANRPQARTMLGYELKVSASAKSEALGSTKLRLGPGQIPDIRLRATPVLANAGETVTIKVLRGPNFTGKLPKKFKLRHELGALETELDPASREARFTLPKDRSGFYEAKLFGGRALVYVRSKTELAVKVEPDKKTYTPGETAKLSILTSAAGSGVSAAVGLIGVDTSLAQLVALPGPSDMAKLRPKIQMQQSAFGVLDAEALTLGRIRGENAKAATILKVSSIPTPAEIDNYVSANGQTQFDPIEPLTDHFYRVLSELHAQARAWEKKAPKGELMRPKGMAELWKRSIDACKKRGEPTADAYGRSLRLHRLPRDLLALTDPRAVIIEGTRLPEDVENWRKWVKKERP